MREKVSAQVMASGYVTDTEGNKSGSLYWTLYDNGDFVISGTGPGVNYMPRGEKGYEKMRPWDNYRDNIINVIFECEFEGYSIYHYNYGASLNSWFMNCGNLESCSAIPDGVTDISYIFYGCKKLNNVDYIPDSVVVMEYAFAKCETITAPPVLSKNLSDNVKQYYYDEDTGILTNALDLTFYGCINLLSTPFFEKCSNINSLIFTFYDCISLKTIQNIPPNINLLQYTFMNCPNVRGILSCEASQITLEGTSFAGFAINNDYLLFVKSNDPMILESIRNESGLAFRGYKWADKFVINLDYCMGGQTEQIYLDFLYGTELSNSINELMKTQVLESYYDFIPEVMEISAPEIENYTFEGWYYDSDYNRPALENDILNPSNEDLLNGSMTLYAKWILNKAPVIEYDYIDRDWFNKEFIINFKFTDYSNLGLKKIVLTNLDTKDVYFEKKWTENPDSYYEMSYLFGDNEKKSLEGISNWRISVTDYKGNYSNIDFKVRLDYTPPVIETDIINDIGQKILFENRDAVVLIADDEMSGVYLLRINPSIYQNRFIDFSKTPFVIKEREIDYVYYRSKDVCGYVLYAIDNAGNFSSRIIITQANINDKLRRIVLRGNYD